MTPKRARSSGHRIWAWAWESVHPLLWTATSILPRTITFSTPTRSRIRLDRFAAPALARSSRWAPHPRLRWAEDMSNGAYQPGFRVDRGEGPEAGLRYRQGLRSLDPGLMPC